ncbi:MAG TPA: hypothetical protein VFC83_02855 [Erysipelotrichaceae bacterium]|nr:hypothetical protein [Erysipelotrichaceae bacterium]
MKKLIRKAATVSRVSIDHDNNKLITIELENASEEILIITEHVRIYNNDDFEITPTRNIQVGREIFVYTRENTPVMMSMPPKYVPALLVVNTNDDYMSHKAMYFDKDLVSADKQVVIGENFLNVIESENDLTIKDLLKEKELLVFYQQATKSIPAIINPEKIIIL